MRIARLLVAGLLAAFVFAAGPDERKEPGAPCIKAVDPSVGKPGDLVTATGEHLDKTRVAELYLTDGKADLKVEVLEQSAEFIRFKIPRATPGRFRLMFLTAAAPRLLLEQPAWLEVVGEAP